MAETPNPNAANPELQASTAAQAKSELPDPAKHNPLAEEPELPGTGKLAQAYGKAKDFVDQLQTHASDKILKPFRAGLDNMADELEEAAESGHTATGGALSSPTRALAEGTGALLRGVPVGKNVKDTAVMAATGGVPELDFSGLAGHEIISEAPVTHAFRARAVGEEGVAAGTRPVATSSAEKAQTYAQNLESMTGKPHEVVQIPLSETEHNVHTQNVPEGEKWFSFKKDVPEEKVIKPGKSSSQSEQKPSAKDIIEKQGLVYKGELTKGSGVHMFEHPDHPGKTAALAEHRVTPSAVKEKMDSKLKDFGVDRKSEASTPMASAEKKELQDWSSKPLKSEDDFIQARKKKAEWDSNQALAKGKVDTDPKAAVPSKNKNVKPVDFSTATEGLAKNKKNATKKEASLPPSDKKTLTPDYLLGHENHFDPNVYSPEDMWKKGIAKGQVPEPVKTI